MNVEEFIEEFEFLLDESGAPEKSEIVAIDKWWEERGSYAETDLAALIKLTGNRWAALTAWCDTTGFDCRSGIDWVITGKASSAIAALGQEARRRLGLEEAYEAQGLFRKSLTGTFS